MSVRPFLVSVLLILALPSPARASQAFSLSGKGVAVTARNYGLFIPGVMLYVNQRGLEKTASVRGEATTQNEPQPARWASRYGSVTLAQFGREAPAGGINEAGLVVEGLGLHEVAAQLPQDARPFVSELEWVQRQLDLHATV